jgi:glycosyltransferase involved in cell wall biosynthesis
VLLVGTGAERDRVEARAAELGVSEQLRFLGWRGDVDRILASSDALVLPSTSNECLPYAILEAMGHGLPVVSTDVAGIPEEVADGETGRVVPPADDAALAEAIADVLRDRDRARAMGAAGRRRLQTEFTVERMTARMRAVWDEALAAR